MCGGAHLARKYEQRLLLERISPFVSPSIYVRYIWNDWTDPACPPVFSQRERIQAKDVSPLNQSGLVFFSFLQCRKKITGAGKLRRRGHDLSSERRPLPFTIKGENSRRAQRTMQREQVPPGGCVAYEGGKSTVTLHQSRLSGGRMCPS